MHEPDAVPKVIRDKLVANGYDSFEALPNNPESKSWADVKVDCDLSNPDINKVINAKFPSSGIKWIHT